MSHSCSINCHIPPACKDILLPRHVRHSSHNTHMDNVTQMASKIHVSKCYGNITTHVQLCSRTALKPHLIPNSSLKKFSVILKIFFIWQSAS